MNSWNHVNFKLYIKLWSFEHWMILIILSSLYFSELGTGHFRKDKMGSFGSNSHGLYRSHFTPTRNSTDDFRNPIGRIKIKVNDIKIQRVFPRHMTEKTTFKVQILWEGKCFEKKYPILLISNVTTKWGIFQIVLAFSEYLNFTFPYLQNIKPWNCFDSNFSYFSESKPCSHWLWQNIHFPI